MKLYATTTSERATKGQGGNEYLDIVVMDKDQRTLMSFRVKPTDNNEYEYEQLFYSTRIHKKGEKLQIES